MQLDLPIFKPLFWVSRRASWICQFGGRGLATNRWLMEHEWLVFDRAVQIQTWLIARIYAEQKHSCQVHLKVLETCFAAGEIPSTPSTLEYFQDLRSLYAEGRYETMLIQLYQLDLVSTIEAAEHKSAKQVAHKGRSHLTVVQSCSLNQSLCHPDSVSLPVRGNCLFNEETHHNTLLSRSTAYGQSPPSHGLNPRHPSSTVQSPASFP